MSHASGFKEFNTYDFAWQSFKLTCQFFCHTFHPSMRNSQEHQPLILKVILRPIFTLGLLLFWFGVLGIVLLWVCFGFFSDTFTSNIDPSVQICHDTQVVSDFTF